MEWYTKLVKERVSLLLLEPGKCRNLPVTIEDWAAYDGSNSLADNQGWKIMGKGHGEFFTFQ